MTVYNGVFHTKGMEKALSDYKEMSKADKDRLQKAFELLDGKAGYVSPAYDGHGYHFIGCNDNEVEKEFMWLMEQDSMFGQYVNDRDRFDRDLENDNYYPDGSISILNGYFEIAKTFNG